MQQIGHLKLSKAGQAMQTFSPIVELRQYTLHPGQRDVLIDLFEREFIETQEAVGMRVIGQFRDLDDPNRFVFVRGFQDMHARREALQAFYIDGQVWKAHREAANATMVDSSNVLLLRPARPASGFSLDPSDRPPPGAAETPQGLVAVTICSFGAPPDTAFLDFFERALVPVLTEAGASMLAYFVTEESANDFPALPIREGEHVFVWFSLFRDQAAYAAHTAALAGSPQWREAMSAAAAHGLTGSPVVVKLLPTARSLLRG